MSKTLASFGLIGPRNCERGYFVRDINLMMGFMILVDFNRLFIESIQIFYWDFGRNFKAQCKFSPIE
jgi:hypothetical protein